jgi:hypothetical protein
MTKKRMRMFQKDRQKARKQSETSGVIFRQLKDCALFEIKCFLCISSNSSGA